MSSKLSLLWLQAFVAVAKSGSLQHAAQRSGLSASTLSSHLQKLEHHLGSPLVDHSKRPLALTAKGHRFLGHAEAVLERLLAAESDMLADGPQAIRRLRLGLIDDFDTDVAPALTLQLARRLPNCAFEHFSRPSHEILQLLIDRRVDAGVATVPVEGLAGLVQRPLLRDPYVVVVPTGADCPDFSKPPKDLPFLRYSPEQHIGRQIEAQLNRLRITLPQRMSAESNQALMTLVAGGQGWTITTATCFNRARNLWPELTLHSFPRAQFAREIALMTVPGGADSLADMLETMLRSLIQARTVEPVLAEVPFLRDQFTMIQSDAPQA
ncbi:MAG: LysR family transcriptional regulator [Alphaproteobacteria bacterium TMED89]|nr:LysR family transcriptional regulator [Rhodospirillaceae bacterium]RPH19733.1 MAG: LysR family transcriptional regulator [Alphaproteobacteria bacterium TMED89]